MLESTLKGYSTIPPALGIVLRLLRELKDEAPMDRITGLVASEPSLSTSVVRLANCAYYGYAKPALSIDEAIQRIGSRELLKLVTLLSGKPLIEQDLACYELSAHEVWRESLATAILMEFFAYDAGEDPGEAYLLGLLHNMGRHPIAQMMARVKPFTRLPRGASAKDTVRWEKIHVGADHPRVAATILARWGFGESQVVPISNQHHPFLARNCRTMACSLNLAVNVAPCVAYPSKVNFSDIELSAAALVLCQLNRQSIDEYIGASVAWLERTCELIDEQLLTA